MAQRFRCLERLRINNISNLNLHILPVMAVVKWGLIAGSLSTYGRDIRG